MTGPFVFVLAVVTLVTALFYALVQLAIKETYRVRMSYFPKSDTYCCLWWGLYRISRNIMRGFRLAFKLRFRLTIRLCANYEIC